MPSYQWLLRALLEYDLLGFQTTPDVENFTHSVLSEGEGYSFSSDGVIKTAQTQTKVGRFPIGIDVEGFRQVANSQESNEQIDYLHRRTMGRRNIIGVDRLDYSKGLPERMLAFRRLLQKHPDVQKRVTLMQIAPPTRENVEAYGDIREELEKLSGAINGEFADFDWTPVRYIHRPIPRHILAALFRGSQVGFVSPLRDGMNLVAKEYVAAQSDDDPGVLVLSKFAGAAEEMEEAVLVNPYDIDEMGERLHLALTMPLEERRERQSALLARIRASDARHWQASFIDALKAQGKAR
ncbi:MAG: trehalose-6-phosphate synthase [Hyphomicrobiaceae bacterium]